nr:PilC/PilY family type IV pilus protein [Cupriavidus taiwanensis]
MSQPPRLAGIAAAVSATVSAAVNVLLAGPAHALVIQDNLNGAASSYDWVALNGACLTAGNGTGSIPGCATSSFTYYRDRNSKLVGGASGSVPDAAGYGALRLTNGDTAEGANGDNQNGAVVSRFTFGMQEGLQVTFSTVTYGGDNLRGTGADGISFYLADGSKSPTVGGLGGSLGYSCSNVNGAYDGVAGGYIGIGIDEFGNFSNKADNTDSGPAFQANRISVRGSGDTNWAGLRAAYPAYYPDSLSASKRAQAVQNTCARGYVQDWSSGKDGGDVRGRRLAYNYRMLGISDLPDKIANQQAVSRPTRAKGIPIVYSLKLTQNGLLSMSYSYNGGAATPVITDQDITQANGPVPASLRFGFAAGTGSGSNVHEITCFKAEPVGQSSSSAGTNVQQSARVEAGSQVYLAYYHPTNWWGELSAQNLLYDPATDSVSIATVANWNAHCTLTGGHCAATGTAVVAQAPDSRRILTWSGSSGIPLRWDANLPDAHKAKLSAGDAAPGGDRLDYLRGDRSKELTAAGAGQFRKRTGVLGDIIDSSPAWVGAPSSPYSGPWTDALYKRASPPEPAGSYDAFRQAKAQRLNVVYVGANDGLLHGFRSGYYNAAGAFVGNDANKPNDGREVLAYMPGAVLDTIQSSNAALAYSSPQYVHNLFVDATPGTGDLYYAGAWHTWLVGGLGPGANRGGPLASKTAAAAGGALYALDVTDPERFSDTPAAASATVIGEWTNTLQCTGDSACGDNLGNTYGTPVIRRLHNGQWAVLFGNGLGSKSGSAGLFIMLVDPADGSRSFRYLGTGYGPQQDPAGASSRNGIAYVTPADLDGDHITDYVYAGDVFGNLWRFDLTSDNPDHWRAGSRPLMQTGGKPISTRVAVGSVPGTGTGAAAMPRVVVAFGTGRRLEQTQGSEAVFEPGGQGLYGVWDWDMAGWNAVAGAQARYASLASATRPLSGANLTQQSITVEGRAAGSTVTVRTVSAGKVCWQGSNACASGNNKYGWQLPLPSATREQVIYNPVIAYGMVIVNTTIPPSSALSQALSCNAEVPSGFTMGVSMGSGGAAAQSFFSSTNSSTFPLLNNGIVSGIGLSGTGTPSVVTAKKRPYLVQQTVGGSGAITQINPGANGAGARLNWIRLR